MQGRWVDSNKVISFVQDYRSRLFGESFNTGVDAILRAATPPLEALKLLIGRAASHRDGGAHLLLSDVNRAYIHALV